jgi:hypothetical protein
MSSSADKDDHDDVKLSSVTEPHENDVLQEEAEKTIVTWKRTATTDGSTVSRGTTQTATKKGEVTII